LRSEDASTAATEDRVAVERALSYLIVTLGNQAATKAVEMQTTFDAAETLYGLSAVAPVQIGKN
jgi:hypothetical protein